MHNRRSNHEMENLDYNNQLQENTRQAAAEFAAITPTVINYEPVTICPSKFNSEKQQIQTFQQSTGILASPIQGNAFLSPNSQVEHFASGAVNREINSPGCNKYSIPNPTNSKDKLVNAIKSILVGANCEEPSSFPLFNGNERSHTSQSSTNVQEDVNTMHGVNESIEHSPDPNTTVDTNGELPVDDTNSEVGHSRCKNCENNRQVCLSMIYVSSRNIMDDLKS